MLLKLLAAVSLGGAVFVFTPGVSGRLIARWNRQIDGYARWISFEFESMLEQLSIARARQVITAAIVVPLVLGYLLAGIIGAVVFGAVGYSGGWLFVLIKRRKRLQRIDDQLVDALLMMANALKAGLSLRQALDLVAQEGRPPIADEFARIVKEMHLGRQTDDALRRFAERVPLEDVKLAVDSILTLRETGGNMSETFQVIAYTVVDRKKVQGKIKAMTAQGMTQGILICTFPLAMMVMFSMLSPDYMRPFFTTPLGWMMLALVFILDGLGLALMFKLVQVEV